MATHSSILAWKTTCTGEPGGLCPWGHKELDRTEHTHTHTHTRTHTQYAWTLESILSFPLALSKFLLKEKPDFKGRTAK